MPGGLGDGHGRGEGGGEVLSAEGQVDVVATVADLAQAVASLLMPCTRMFLIKCMVVGYWLGLLGTLVAGWLLVSLEEDVELGERYRDLGKRRPGFNSRDSQPLVWGLGRSS